MIKPKPQNPRSTRIPVKTIVKQTDQTKLHQVRAEIPQPQTNQPDVNLQNEP